MSDDLVVFLLARIAEDEQMARASRGDSWEVGPAFGARDNRVYVRREGDLIDSVGTCVIAGQISNVPEFRANAAHIARWDPARALAECEAKRELLELVLEIDNADRCTESEWGNGPEWATIADRMLKLMASPYSAHPDYRLEWSPQAASASRNAG